MKLLRSPLFPFSTSKKKKKSKYCISGRCNQNKPLNFSLYMPPSNQCVILGTILSCSRQLTRVDFLGGRVNSPPEDKGRVLGALRVPASPACTISLLCSLLPLPSLDTSVLWSLGQNLALIWVSKYPKIAARWGAWLIPPLPGRTVLQAPAVTWWVCLTQWWVPPEAVGTHPQQAGFHH